MRVLAVIPARGGSKGIPNKNMVDLGGKPLLDHTIDVALSCDQINYTCLSSESPDICEHAAGKGVHAIRRPASLAADDSPTLPTILHAIQELEGHGLEFDLIMTLQPTSPLRSVSDLQNSIQRLLDSQSSNSLVSCVPVPHVFSPRCLMTMSCTGHLKYLHKELNVTRRQDKETLYARNGAAIYITRRSVIDQAILVEPILPYVMPYERSVDIDTYQDLVLASKLL